MFVGTFEHSLDEKGRVVLPATFRSKLADCGFVSQYQGCLGLWTEEGFGAMADRLMAKVDEGKASQSAVRAFSADAMQVKPDSQGRILLPQRLRETAGLDREVVIIGAINRIEIWDADTYRDERSKNDESFLEVITEHGI